MNANEMAWVLRLVPQKPRTGEANGRDIFLRNCSACHRADRKESLRSSLP